MSNSKTGFYIATLLALSQTAIASSHARVPKMYVSNNDTVSVVDIQSQQVIDTLSGFVEPFSLTLVHSRW